MQSTVLGKVDLDGQDLKPLHSKQKQLSKKRSWEEISKASKRKEIGDKQNSEKAN